MVGEATRSWGEEAMAILTLGALFSLLVLASADHGPVLRLPVESVAVDLAAGQREFDYFVLALQWPGTYCLRTHHCCPKNGCCRSSPLVDFTIHGLWPDYNDGSWPSCCSGSDFDINKISSLMPTMEKYWPSLSCGSTTLCHGGKGLFWAHEWEKHGTCSYPVIKDEYNYFSTVLDLYFKSNITGVLSNAGFLVSNAEKYPLGDVIATIEKAVGASPLLVCKHGSIEELRICFYKDFKPRDCIIRSSTVDDTSNLRSSCPRYISFPTYAAPIVPEDISAARTWAGGITFEPLTQIMKSLWNWS